MSVEAIAIEDRLEIEGVLISLCAALDGPDWELMSQCLDRDVSWSSQAYGLHKGISAWIENQRSERSKISHAQHLIGNVQIVPDGPGRALATSYLQGYVVFRSSPDQVVRIVGTYHDELAKGEGGWLLTRRRFDRVWLDPRD